MMKILKEGLVTRSNNLNKGKQSKAPKTSTGHRYLEAARRQPPESPLWPKLSKARIPEIEELKIYERRSYVVVGLTDLYFYTNLEGSLGVIRRSLIHSVFEGRDDNALNFNYHRRPRDGIGQIICPKWNAQLVIDAMKNKGFLKLPETCNPLELSHRNNSMGKEDRRP